MDSGSCENGWQRYVVRQKVLAAGRQTLETAQRNANVEENCAEESRRTRTMHTISKAKVAVEWGVMAHKHSVKS